MSDYFPLALRSIRNPHLHPRVRVFSYLADRTDYGVMTNDQTFNSFAAFHTTKPKGFFLHILPLLGRLTFVPATRCVARQGTFFPEANSLKDT